MGFVRQTAVARRRLVAVVALAAGVLAVGVAGQALGVAARSSTSACKNPTAQPRFVGPGEGNELSGVAATSGCKAWAVGYYQGRVGDHPFDSTLVEYWDGNAWKHQPSPNPDAEYNFLYGVAATSPTNAWAVGYGVTAEESVILHWDGTAWKVQPSPNTAGALTAVAATSSTNAWAVDNSGKILHWDGTAWTLQPSPSLPSEELFGVAATSPTNAWAVGDYYGSGGQQTLIEHWDGTAWNVQPSPSPGDRDHLFGVAATSSTNAWAVGNYRKGPKRFTRHTLVEHWNGTAWKVQPSPSPGLSSPGGFHFDALEGVAAASPIRAWAVGNYSGRTLVEYWNGTAWKHQPSPNPGSRDNYLYGVAATSRTNAWAVGNYTISRTRSLALHWDGTTWSP